MADERQVSSAAPGNDLNKDPVFLLMITGQIESAEVCFACKILRGGDLYHTIKIF